MATQEGQEEEEELWTVARADYAYSRRRDQSYSGTIPTQASSLDRIRAIQVPFQHKHLVLIGDKLVFELVHNQKVMKL